MLCGLDQNASGFCPAISANAIPGMNRMKWLTGDTTLFLDRWSAFERSTGDVNSKHPSLVFTASGVNTCNSSSALFLKVVSGINHGATAGPIPPSY